MSDKDQYIPKGHHLVEDADGARWIKDSSELAPAACSAGGMSLGEAATIAARDWCGPLTQNHDPSFWKSIREAYADGYMRGFNECASRQPNEQDQRPPKV